jgi:glucose-specific phosphotransferase system IIA component
MLSFFKKKIRLLSPMDGKCIPIEETPDEVFSKKILGDGVVVVPSSGEVRAAFDSKISHVQKTGHAYGLINKNGFEILIHIGINTVELNGKGFQILVKENQEVHAGDLISKVDLDFLKQNLYALYTPIIIINNLNIKLKFKYGIVKSGVTPINY